jgi:hypothetical protein
MKALKKGERRPSVVKSVWHHGQYSPERPWCSVTRSIPGSAPGEPGGGIRYLRSFAERDRAIRDAAEARARMSRRYVNAVAKAEAILAEETRLAAIAVEDEIEDLTVLGR